MPLFHKIYLARLQLTHSRRVTHICDGNPTIIGSYNGRRQAIIWTNAGIMLIAMTIWSECIHFYSEKYISKCRLRNSGHFVSASMY